MKAKVMIIITALFVFLFLPVKFISANTISTDFNYTWLDELNKITELDEKGLPVIQIDIAEKQGLSEEAIKVGQKLNEIVSDIKMNGESAALSRMDRSIFPIGSYGNYCGYGNNGYSIPAIDDLDMACFYHDKCFRGFFANNRSCNTAFLARLTPIINANSWYTVKGAYARAAYALFSKFV